MAIPLKITFRGIDHSDSIEAYVRSRADKLASLSGDVVACHVAVEAPHRSRHHGRHYRIRLDLAIPGGELVVDRCRDEDRNCEDPYAAIDDAFDNAWRRLHDGAARRRAENGRS